MLPDGLFTGFFTQKKHLISIGGLEGSDFLNVKNKTKKTLVCFIFLPKNLYTPMYAYSINIFSGIYKVHLDKNGVPSRPHTGSGGQNSG
jgi:hypothetical protein